VITGNSLFTLDGRFALITGASRGLGLAMAEGLAEVGAIVALNGRNVNTLEPVASAMRGRDQDRDEREQAQHRPILPETWAARV
jgi:gluconate 5-dehydrogenase